MCYVHLKINCTFTQRPKSIASKRQSLIGKISSTTHPICGRRQEISKTLPVIANYYCHNENNHQSYHFHIALYPSVVYYTLQIVWPYLIPVYPKQKHVGMTQLWNRYNYNEPCTIPFNSVFGRLMYYYLVFECHKHLCVGLAQRCNLARQKEWLHRSYVKTLEARKRKRVQELQGEVIIMWDTI